MLDVSRVRRSFGGVYAVDDVSLEVSTGEVHAVIGPNGAGKSTLFNLIVGQLPVESGEIAFAGEPIQRFSPSRRAALGMAIVFQGARIFRGMTVLENVSVGAHTWSRTGFAGAVFRSRRHRREEDQIFEAARAAIDKVGLSSVADQPAEALPLGHQRRLQVARALVARPRLLMLDEPASGLRHEERRDLAELIEEMRAEGITIMLVEHDVAFVTRVADTMTVLDLGRVIARGRPAEVFRDPRVVAAYIGSEAAA